VSDEAPPYTAQDPRPDEAFATDVAPDPGTLDDASDLRGTYFRQSLQRRRTKIWIAVWTVLGFAIGIGSLGIIFGLFGAVAAFLISIWVYWGKASSASEQNFFEQYVSKRGMSLSDGTSLPGATPLLRKGDDRHTDEVMTGPLADGVDGTLALYTYTDKYTDDNGQHETDYRFTVAMTDLPDCVEHVAKLYCNRKSGFRFMEGVEDTFRKMERVHLESDALEDHYEIFSTKGQDQNWLRQLFSPTFIVWLTDSAPEKFAFELEDGVLCCNVKGQHKDTAHLDTMRSAAAAVAKRIREEAAE
jgi:hypothetical protein